MTEEEAIANMQAALKKFEEARQFATAGLASCRYAHYAQAAYALRHAEKVLHHIQMAKLYPPQIR